MFVTLHSPLTPPLTQTSPIVVLHIAVEMDLVVPACLAEESSYLLLDGRMDQTRAVAELIIVGLAMTRDEIGAHKRFYLAWHIVVEVLQVTFSYFGVFGVCKQYSMKALALNGQKSAECQHCKQQVIL